MTVLLWQALKMILKAVKNSRTSLAAFTMKPSSGSWKTIPDSYAAQTYIAAAEELVNGTDAQSGENGYYTYIYNPPAGYAWQVVALVGEEITGGTEIPDVPSVPEPKYYSAAWTAPAQKCRRQL